MHRYNHKDIEKKWQKEWEEKRIYATLDNSDKPKAYVLDMFPYPSGEGLHVGHPKGYIATDIYSRYKRMKGYSVLHPMGWDAFGLPAENFALKNKLHPRVAVEKNIARYKEQLSNIGLDYDWAREVNTTDPEFYKWSQWIFLKLHEKGLAFESYEPINWCPSCQTGLAAEDLEDGKCERCGSEVEKKPMRQWVLKITDYADRLLGDLDTLPDWPDYIKEMQRNWIGRSEGAEIEFGIKNTESRIKAFTTRPDTLFGATYLVLSPEHKLVAELLENKESGIKNQEEVEDYIKKVKGKSELERQEFKEKTGVELKGVTAINPGNEEEIPVWVADYVLAGYGTGAIMAVPAHDERDFEFAKKFDLSIKQVIAPETGIRRDEEEVRDGGCAVVFDPEKQLYAVGLGKEGYARLFSGGVDDGEHIQSGVEREVTEESGLWDFKQVEEIGTALAHYHNHLRKVNRIAKATCFLIILNSSKLKDRALEDHEDFDLEWMSADEILSNWSQYNQEKDLDHWVLFLKKSVARAIELGFDKSSDKNIFSHDTYTGEGVSVNSGKFNGLTSEEAKEKITQEFGGKKTTYRLQDWVFSRQRYWGEPIPIIHCEKCGAVAVPEKDLPVVLPEVESYEPTGTGESPLANISEWVNVECPKCGGNGKRETNTMPQWAGSSWYYLRFMDPGNSKALVDPLKEKYWSPVDLYVGGAEHATRHLIYARFWHKFLFDIGAVSTKEPFIELHSVGLIQAEDGRKMSKRYGNVINPDDIVDKLGADSLRIYEMFMGPFENSIAWSTDGIVGARRFIERVWRAKDKITGVNIEGLEKELHKTIKKVGEDIVDFKFNTAISQMMTFINAVEKKGQIGRKQFEFFIKILAPFAPHVTEELWHELGNQSFIHLELWPTYDAKNLEEEEVTMAVQVNGKVRAEIRVSLDEEEKSIKEKAVAAAEKWVGKSEIKKVILVPGRLVNIVV
jgi:leucyl-tRNA synthetase